jgi:hypothetical protein
MAGINGITSPNGQGSSGGVTDDLKLTKHLQSARVVSEGANKNFVVPDSAKKKAEALLASLPSTTKPSTTEQAAAAEQGHATGPTPEQQNAAIRASNAPIEASIAELEMQQKHLQKLFSHDLAKGDGVLTQGELQWLATASTSPAQKEAALWLLSRPDIYASLPKRWTLFGGDGATAGVGGTGLDIYASSIFVADLASQIAAKKKTLKPLIDVPAPAVPSPGAGSTPPDGTTNTPPTTSQPPATPTPPNGNAPASSNPLVPEKKPFSSTAEGEQRMLEASGHIQDELDRFTSALANASAKGDQGAIAEINQHMTKLQAGMSAIMQMLKQLNEMQSNMAKMYSEMAMSAVRNMR